MLRWLCNHMLRSSIFGWLLYSFLYREAEVIYNHPILDADIFFRYSCRFHAWKMYVSCTLLLYFRHVSCILFTLILCISGIFHAWSMHVSCMLLPGLWPFAFSGWGDCWKKALGTKLLEMTNEDAFMNPFGGLFEVKNAVQWITSWVVEFMSFGDFIGC